VGQRLVRRICASCAEPYEPTDTELGEYAALGGPTKTSFVRGQGCEYCAGTGFRGRIAVYEVMEVTEQIGQLVVARATPHEVREAAVAQGMRPMRVEAAHLIASDLTTVDEVHRNVFIAGSTYVPPAKPKTRARKAAAKPAAE
jgi:type IV pilus assembly protein PilB